MPSSYKHTMNPYLIDKSTEENNNISPQIKGIKKLTIEIDSPENHHLLYNTLVLQSTKREITANYKLLFLSFGTLHEEGVG